MIVRCGVFLLIAGYILGIAVSENYHTDAEWVPIPKISLQGQDHVKTDMFGTSFVFPQPVCPKGTFFKVQVTPRGFEPCKVRIYLWTVDSKQRWSLQHEDGAMRQGEGTTLFFSCFFTQLTLLLQLGVMRTTASHEVILHVLAGTDSFAVVPVPALGAAYTLLSISPLPWHTFFFTVLSPVAFVVSVTDMNGTSFSKSVRRADAFTMLSDTTLTGTTVTCNESCFVITGTATAKGWAMVEHMIPENTWGWHYILPTPLDSEVLITAYAKSGERERKIRLQTKSFESRDALMADGEVHDLRDIAGGSRDRSLIMLSSSNTSSPFFVLCLLTSPVVRSTVISGLAHHARLHGTVSLPPLEQYLDDPCARPPFNVFAQQAFVVGPRKQAVASGQFDVFRHHDWFSHKLGVFWARITDTSSSSVFEDAIYNATALPRLWFHDWFVLRQTNVLYFVDGGFRLRPLKQPCLPNFTLPADDNDSDCDGLVDEELKNLKDDDGDGEIDEDLTSQNILDCKKGYLGHRWDYERHRVLGYSELIYKFSWNHPMAYLKLVIISAMLGMLMVFAFIFFIWIVDLLDQYQHPGARARIFYWVNPFHTAGRK